MRNCIYATLLMLAEHAPFCQCLNGWTLTARERRRQSKKFARLLQTFHGIVLLVEPCLPIQHVFDFTWSRHSGLNHRGGQ
jgi:hypothetical protein